MLSGRSVVVLLEALEHLVILEFRADLECRAGQAHDAVVNPGQAAVGAQMLALKLGEHAASKD